VLPISYKPSIGGTRNSSLFTECIAMEVVDLEAEVWAARGLDRRANLAPEADAIEDIEVYIMLGFVLRCSQRW
jgi:hypothetical protein